MEDDDPAAARRPPWPGQAELSARLADVLPWALMVLQPDGRLVYANAAARSLLARRQLLGLTAEQHVRPMAASGAPEPRRTCTDWPAALQRAALGRPAIVRWPLGCATLVRLGENEAGLVMVAAADALPPQAALAAFAQQQGLSRAERAVLERLARGERTADVAEALHLPVSTVRSRVVRLRAKTGHASVPELLHALALLPPVADASR